MCSLCLFYCCYNKLLVLQSCCNMMVSYYSLLLAYCILHTWYLQQIVTYPGETIEKLTEMIQPCHEIVTWSYDFWNIVDMNCHLKAGQQTINKLMPVSCQKMTSKIYNFLSSYLHALMVIGVYCTIILKLFSIFRNCYF